jgi:uncharacterized membrane protein YgcG
MEYNSSREELIIPEYGRHIQNMIRYARGIEEKEKRQQFIETIVGLMMQMHPQNRNLEDYRDKLWRHVFQIAEYDLVVDTPSGYIPTHEDSRKKPDRVPYPSKETRFRHYGHNVQKLIAKAIKMEDGEKKDGFVQVIGSYMKLAYRTWNREHYVSDDIIIEDLEHLSGGKLEMIEDASLDNLSRSQMRRSGSNSGPSSSGGGRQYQRSGGRSGGGRSGGRDNRSGGRQHRRRKKN